MIGEFTARKRRRGEDIMEEQDQRVEDQQIEDQQGPDPA